MLSHRGSTVAHSMKAPAQISSASSSSCLFREQLLPEIWKSHIVPFLHPREVCLLTSTCKFARDVLLRGYYFTYSRIILPDSTKFLLRIGARVGSNFTMRSSRGHDCDHVHLHLEYEKHPIRNKAYITKGDKLVIPINHHDSGKWAFLVRDLTCCLGLSTDKLVFIGAKAKRYLYVNCNDNNDGQFLAVQLGQTFEDVLLPAYIYFTRKSVDDDFDEVIKLELPSDKLEAACMSIKVANRLIISVGAKLRLYDITTGKCETELLFFDDFCCSKMVTLEGIEDELILCADERGCVQVWDIGAKVPTCRGMDTQLLQMYFNYTYTLYALRYLNFGVFGSLDNFIRLYRLVPVQATSNNSQLFSFTCTHVLGGHTGIVTSLISLNDDENTLVSSSDDQSIKVWKEHPKSGYSCNRSIRVHENCVETLIIHRNPLHQSIVSINCDLQVSVTALDESRLLNDDGPGILCRYKNDYDSEEEYFDSDGFFRK